jgi:hypothetical protein
VVEHKFVTDIIQRRDESRKWMRKNLWDELTTVWQGIKCRTSPIYKRDSAGNELKEEDKARTNVAMPDLNIIYRRNAARMTAQPYRLHYIGGDPQIADMLSALAMQQYARSNENQQDVRLMLASEAFGYGYTKLKWDTLARTMMFRRAIVKNDKVVFRDRASIMKAQGAPSEEINAAVTELGPDMDDDELSLYIGKSGVNVNVPTDVKKYEGPIVQWVFNGNLFIEPFALTLDQSDYAIEQYRENDLWLKKQMNLTYEDPDTGVECRAFDGDAVEELLSMEPDIEIRPDELRDMFFGAVGKQDEQQYRLPKNLRVRPKYDILEQHAMDEEDGRMWITWVSEKYRDKALGRMPYPWDLYGKYAYTECVPMPDLMSAFGDSTPRLVRHLYAMHNLIVAQNFDYITNLLKPFILKQAGMEIQPDIVVRGLFRELTVSNLNGVKPMTEPPLPSGAFEREAQVMRMMTMCEPSMTSADAGTADNPQAGKTATTAILASKAADALTQFKFDNRNLYLRELGMKKLWMNQQAAEDPWEIEKKNFPPELSDSIAAMAVKPQWALSDRYGKTVAIRLDPMEIQEDYEVEPEAGSYLAVDDELKQAAVAQLAQTAAASPGVLDPQKIVRFQLKTIRGIGNPDDFLAPPQSPPPPIKGNINFNVPLDKMPADLVNQILPLLGMQPSQELVERDQAQSVVRTSDMADAADNMLSPPQHEQDGMQMLHESSMQGADHAHETTSKLLDHAHQTRQTALQGAQQRTQQAAQHEQESSTAAQDHARDLTKQLIDQAHQRSMQVDKAGLDAANAQLPGSPASSKPNGKG